MAMNASWSVRLFEILDFIVRQLNVDTTDDILQILQTCTTDDGGGDARLGQHPGNRDLRHTDTLLLREFLHTLVDLFSANATAVVRHQTEGTAISRRSAYTLEEETHMSVCARVDWSRRGRVRKPRARGDQGVAPTLNSLRVGNISLSSSRYAKLYWFCITIKGVRLWVMA